MRLHLRSSHSVAKGRRRDRSSRTAVAPVRQANCGESRYLQGCCRGFRELGRSDQTAGGIYSVHTHSLLCMPLTAAKSSQGWIKCDGPWTYLVLVIVAQEIAGIN